MPLMLTQAKMHFGKFTEKQRSQIINLISKVVGKTKVSASTISCNYRLTSYSSRKL